MTEGCALRSAGLSEDSSKTLAHLRGALVEYHSRKGFQCFRWTEECKSTLTIVRRCLYLLHARRACSDAADQTCSPASSSSPHRNGTARCYQLLPHQTSTGRSSNANTARSGSGANVGSSNVGPLHATASALLAAAWDELRHMTLREIAALAAIMAPLDNPHGGEQEGLAAAAGSARGCTGAAAAADPLAAAACHTCSAALRHMRRQLPVWRALQRASRDLLGDLSESQATSLAPAPHAALRCALELLLAAG
ncbi:hypothetical protein Agub_g4043, partial [Astrephomene gubernaculifera]